MTYQEIGVRRELAKQQDEVSYQSNPCPKCETQNITQKAAIVYNVDWQEITHMQKVDESI